MGLKYFLLVFSLFTLACRVEPDDELPMDTDPLPFDQVPETADVVMYEINIRAFSQTGDLPGILPRLDSIKALGVNVIWLMPIFPVGIENAINSPYCIRDFKAVNPEFGDLDDLKNLVEEAHQRDMAVILDWVANHTSWDNAWIGNPGWYTEVNGQIVHPPGTNWMDVADLNFNNTDMRLAMIDALKYWIQEANIDGYRCDAADFVPFDFWQQAIDSLETIPDRDLILLAEGARTDHFAAGFQMNFGWAFYGQLKNVFAGSPATGIYSSHAGEYGAVPAGKHRLRFTTNHDESAWDATPMVLFNGQDGALAASVIAAYMGGVPLLYSSQEVGRVATLPFFSSVPINWTTNPGMHAAYREIFGLYHALAPLRRGALTNHSIADVVAFRKSYEGEEVLVLVNVRENPVSFDIPAAYQQTEWTDARTGLPETLGASIALNGYEWRIWRRGE